MSGHKIIFWLFVLAFLAIFGWWSIDAYNRAHELPDIMMLPTSSPVVTSTPVSPPSTVLYKEPAAPTVNMDSTYIPPVTATYVAPNFSTPAFTPITPRPYVPHTPGPITGPTPDPCHVGWGC